MTPALPVPLLRRAALALATVVLLSAPALADPVAPDQASRLVTDAGNQLVGLLNGGGDTPERRQQLQAIVDQDVDVDGIARFCLGRFWRTATPDQQRDFVQVFHATLMHNLTADLGDYQGVTFKVGQVSGRPDGSAAVETVITRPNNAPNDVQWIVIARDGTPKISDVVVEGTRLSLTTRNDYLSYLQNNGNDVNALISALRSKAGS